MNLPDVILDATVPIMATAAPNMMQSYQNTLSVT
jgi:hypothetical protein